MESREPAEPVSVFSPVGRDSEGSDGERAEVRAIAGLRSCPLCGVANSLEDVFCTGCGRALPSLDAPQEGNGEESLEPNRDDVRSLNSVWATVPSLPTPFGTDIPLGSEPRTVARQEPLQESTQSPPVTTTLQGTRSDASPWSRWPWLSLRAGNESPSQRLLRGTLAVAAFGVVGTLVFGLLWHVQTGHTHRVQTSPAMTQAELARVQTRLGVTKARLQSVTSLAEKRRAVLLEAQNVLTKVDPLLSSVDGIQNQAGVLKDQGDAIATDADTLMGTMATLASYLIQTDTAYVDYTYVESVIGDVRSELDTLRADESLFGGANSRYDGASTKFGNKADAFSTAVRGLQKQLNAVTAK
jgi:hypothetical protein